MSSRSRYRIIGFLLLLGGVLVGCAAPLIYAKPGGTEEDFRRDKYDCVQQSRTSWSGGGRGMTGLAIMAGAQIHAQQQANALFKMCMEARGYTGREQKEGETVAALTPPVAPPVAAPPLVLAPPAPSPPPAPVVVLATPPPPPPSIGVTPVSLPLMASPASTVQIHARYTTARLLLQPKPDAEPLSVITAQGPLQVIEARPDWLYIETPDGRRGWIIRDWVQN